MMMPVYLPREDSELLAHQVVIHAKGVVLDVGTGSGIQARAAADCISVNKVYGVDINPAAVKYCLENSKSNHKIEYLVSDLFSAFKKNKKFRNVKFDTIIFNPPYLPKDHEKPDIALIGGKKGYEVLERFLDEVNDFLAPGGVVLILFSSLTNKGKVDEIIARNLLDSKLLHSTGLFYETLYVYLLKKSFLARELSLLGVSCLKFLAKGKRKFVYSGCYKGKKVAVKAVLPGKKSTSVELEAKFLKILGGQRFVPKLLHATPDFLVAEFVDGVFLKDFILSAKKPQLKFLFKEVLRQCFVLDKLGINKDEMLRPFKHVLIDGKSVSMIDFERCRYSEEPKNVTQFCQFLANHVNFLRERSFDLNFAEIISRAKTYKDYPSKKTFEKIVELV